MAPTHALCILEQFAELILSGQKTWELRGSSTNRRGPVALAVSKSSHLYGEITITGCIKVAQRNPEGDLIPCFGYEHQYFIGWEENMKKHCVREIATITYDTVWAWTLESPLRYEEPKFYKHPKGAIVWVKLEEDNAQGKPKSKPRPKTKAAVKKPSKR